MSIVVSVITAMYINLAKSKEVNCWMITDMVLLFIPIVCLIRTVWFSIKVFERKTYHIVSAEEYILAYSKPNPYEELIENLSKYIRCNKEVNNRKVDNMHNAQKFFTWAIISIGVFAFFLLLRNLIDFDFMIPYWIGFCRK
jgi:hypothetical protein